MTINEGLTPTTNEYINNSNTTTANAQSTSTQTYSTNPTDELSLSDAGKALAQAMAKNAATTSTTKLQSTFSMYTQDAVTQRESKVTYSLSTGLENADEIIQGIRDAMFLHRDQNTETTKEDRALMREAALKLAEYIAKNNMGKNPSHAESFLNEIKRLKNEAELEEQGYIRIYSVPGDYNYKYGRPTDDIYRQYDIFLDNAMTDEEKEKFYDLKSRQDQYREGGGRAYEDFYVSMVEKYIMPVNLAKKQEDFLAGKIDKIDVFAKEEKAFDEKARIEARKIEIFGGYEYAAAFSKWNMKSILQLFSQPNGKTFHDILSQLVKETVDSIGKQ